MTRHSKRVLRGVALASLSAIAGAVQAVDTPRLQRERVAPEAMKRLVVAKPDLVVSNARVRLAHNCRPGKPVFYVVATVTNVGKGYSPARSDAAMMEVRDLDGSNWANGAGLPALAPKATTEVTIPLYYIQADPFHMAGTHQFAVAVNPRQVLTESDTRNNAFGPFSVTIPANFCQLLPDIVSQNGISIDGKAAPWGGTINLSDNDAQVLSNNQCAYRITYDMINTGPTPTTVFSNRLVRGTDTISTTGNLTLGAGQGRNVTVVVYLPPGQHAVGLILDAGKSVAEINEANNKQVIHLNVAGPCGGALELIERLPSNL